MNKKINLTRPLNNLIKISTKKLLKTITPQLKKKRLFKIKKFQTYKICWLNKPFFRYKKPFGLTRRHFFRLKHKSWHSLLRRWVLTKKKKIISKSFKIRHLRKQKKEKKAKQKKQHLFLKRWRRRKKVKRNLFARFITRRKNYTRQRKGKNSFLRHTLFTKSLLHFGTTNFRILHTFRMQPSIFYELLTTFRILLRGKKKKKRKKRRKHQHVWRFFLADVPVSRRPKHIRMGKGKGDIQFWIFRAKKGISLFELNFFSKKRINYITAFCEKKINYHLTSTCRLPARWKNIFFQK